MHIMTWKSALVTSFIVIVMSQTTTQNVIYRPAFFPVFTEDSDDFTAASAVEVKRSQGDRNLMRRQEVNSIPCPNDMTEYECYHTFMAVWTRVMQEDKLGDMQQMNLLRRRLSG
ncbi:hypothetical protein ACOMHN_052304 [Nucella lapillus]